MTESETQKEVQKPSILAKFAMDESEDSLTQENEEHVHVEGCCSCHNNIGK